MKRINLIRTQLRNITFRTISAYDYLSFDDFLTKEEREFRDRYRKFLNEKVVPEMPKYLDKQEFPEALIKDYIKTFPGILGLSHKGYGSINTSPWLSYVLIMEMAKVDMSFATFCLVHGSGVVMETLYQLGNEEQKAKYLPKLMSLEMIGSFCLTEPDIGSDAYNITTTAEEDGDYFIINGTKRWIGNADRAGLFIVWAKDKQNKQINGYLVDRELGVQTQTIKTKGSVRSVQNCEVYLRNVRVHKSMKLDTKNFKDSISKVFLASRIGLSWAVVGVCMGVYDKSLDYLTNRKQFGKPLASFQMVQEKLFKIISNTQACLFLCKRMTELYLSNKATIGKAGLLKAFCTSKGRKCVSLARELLGANGILFENYVMKAFVDMEATHTYEGTYDINVLIAGKELTGKQALI
jgi:alkylation response protein AidB-like acyl-CoA dehydrogenase